MNQPLLKVKNLKVEINKRIILDNINFELYGQETLAVIGPNGAGKTTLFKALLDLVSYSGKIEWQKGIKIGYVPQKLAIESDMPLTTREFFSLKEKNITAGEIENALMAVGFNKNQLQGKSKTNILDKKIGVLSGGELQRVIIAWAIVDHPQVLLFDEPTAGIDISAETTIYSLLHELSQKQKLTILLISHELQLVNKYATNVVCLNKKEVCYGPPQDVFMNQNMQKLFGRDIAFYKHH